jgi:glycosyltransferase involved in cell wall biosynthesis
VIGGTADVSCSAPPGVGGLGRHCGELVELIRRSDRVGRWFSTAGGNSVVDPNVCVVPVARTTRLARTWPVRTRPALRHRLPLDAFDRSVARRIARTGARGAVRFVGFSGQTLRSFDRAPAAAYERLELMAANSHVSNVRDRHRQAIQRYPFESTWLGRAEHERTVAEYGKAAVIYVGSDYSWRTFVAAGVPEAKLVKLPFRAHPRFRPASAQLPSDYFGIVYTGSLTVMKGVPVLVEAVRSLPFPDLRLTLVGGWASRGMGRYLRYHLAEDRRLRLAPGDPLPELHRAQLYVHPSFEDGFGYGPVEAMACGVPVLVTADTGMAERIESSASGRIVPAGDVPALADAIAAAYHRR